MRPCVEVVAAFYNEATRVERILLLCSSKIQNSPNSRSRFCCGREPVRKERLIVRIGVHRVADRHHPRECRELRSPAEMRKLLNRKIIEQDKKCAICREEFTDYNNVVPDHKDPKGYGRSDQSDNGVSLGVQPPLALMTAE